MNCSVSDLEHYYQWTIGFISDLKKATIEKIDSWVQTGQLEETDDEEQDPQKDETLERNVKCLG
jgi:hypothetical protein